MNFQMAICILSTIEPKRRKYDRYRQRDELQHMIVPYLPTDDRDAFERRLNRHFRL